MNITKMVIEFVITFLVIYLLYYFFIVKKYKKNDRYVPVEVSLILVKNKIDSSKIDLYKMIKNVSLLTSLILSITITLIDNLSKNIIISILIGVSFSVVLAYIIYGFIGSHYKNSIDKDKKI